MIPKIIHQVWVGSTPIPDREKELCDKVLQKHPSWEYRFWNNHNILTDLDPLFTDRIHDLSTKIRKASFLADYIKLAVVYQYGGVYLDCDMDVCGYLDTLDLNQNLIVSTQKRSDFMQFAFFAAEMNNSIIYEILSKSTLFYFQFFASYFHKKYHNQLKNISSQTGIKHTIFNLDKIIDIQVLDRRYFFDGIIAKHYGLLSHKRSEYNI